MLTDARPRRQYRQVADQILGLASGQGLGPGARLPSERDLAEQLGVSRPSLREALIALEVEGHVEIRMGSGVYLGARPPEPGADQTGESPLELLQARCIIESAIAEEAARRATPDLIARLDRNLAEMGAAVHDTPVAIRTDGEFHITLASGIGNAVLGSLTENIYARRLSPLFAQFSTHFEGPRTWRLALAEHGAIRDAIAEGDPAAAREAMRHHLTESQRRFIEGRLFER
ncbi:FadR/GntR family transcriptional regulator [Paracoccus shanxieyensis]|uniref:FCD domain-containing protein n=1 Tax=Paracoccus shanxieyensis TaxID=2675752 RepID=A0A6L6IWA2_9RHOB|nr:FadR/GntR family transcriptional regulator [Paracoccus shanxieyensis]MTH64483.1 FCD domain-containing protein [Paracoccus shanxieyensis]MTH87524.1 FCD domain-containing protein [Paracoccus shanxieyensis]